MSTSSRQIRRYAVQGWKTDEPDTAEIPHKLLWFTEPGTCISGLRDTGRGSLVLAGAPLDDPEALEIMLIPAPRDGRGGAGRSGGAPGCVCCSVVMRSGF